MAKQGICVNIGNCENANNKRELTVQDGQEFNCPECGKRLVPIKKEHSSVPIWYYLLGVSLLGGIAWTVWNFTKKQDIVNNPFPIPDTTTIPTLPVDPNSTTNYFLTDFFYSAPLPDPKTSVTKGIVELGATGFNSFVVDVDGQRNWKLQKAVFGSSLVYEHMATEDDIRKGLIEYISQILKDGVKGQNIQFIASSGASKADTVIKIMKGIRDRGYVVNTVTPEQEAKFGLRSVLPKGYENKAFVVDLGSSNTKIAYVENGVEKGFDTFGSKYFQLNYTDEQVRADIQKKMERIPKAARGLCFIIGGVPFDLANQGRKDNKRYSCLKSPNAYTPKGARQKSGLNIISAIANATQCRKFVFDSEANFSIGYLLSLPL